MIYVITHGEYSDYHICAVATTEERAEELRRMYCDDYCQAEIETYEENVPSYEWYNNEPHGYWTIYFKENGELYDQPEYYLTEAHKTICVLENRFTGEPYKIIVRNINTNTPQEAFKIACDARAKYLAEKYNL